MLNDPVESIHYQAAKLRSEGQAFAIATVIDVQGSASALTGSKALFDNSGKNILGWVGGGCAERYIGEQSVQALQENKTRIVWADLDDEIFGLGVACGGRMQIFIDPIPIAETVLLPIAHKHQNEVKNLARSYGWNLQDDSSGQVLHSFADLFLKMTEVIAKKRARTGLSLRESKDLQMNFMPNKNISARKQVTIVGRTRITEALARHFTLLSFQVRAMGPALQERDYPSQVQCHCLESYEDIEFQKDEIVIIASHTSQDPILVKKALEQNAAYVSMVGSRKRAFEVFNYLGWRENQNITVPLFVPAGIDIQARNPDEIALSIVAEVLRNTLQNSVEVL